MITTTHDIESIRLVSRPCHKATFAIDPIDRDANDGTCDCGARWSATCGQDIEEWYLVHLPPMPFPHVAVCLRPGRSIVGANLARQASRTGVVGPLRPGPAAPHLPKEATT